MTAFGKWRDLIVFDVFAFPSLCRQHCLCCLSLHQLLASILTFRLFACVWDSLAFCYFLDCLFPPLNMDHSMHMGHGHGGMDHGDMDMGGQCNMNVRYSSGPRDNTCIGSR